ncbi:hypothetical protein ASPVEDRAFT_668992 [Aspergillus versicolor CBS 583.65]|uniref:Bacteriophage T5 Orf172 DNA-binding domain-containing protein n=1 Tax=Aspergillus versicolor CBS 583.65 TaxID=1036611 RepID=A0A1L9PLD1_ASPVE|nr:uncharacterized protein ASPVEDRAFT_668992 [Aspergillus versicolor CBS 583.65]OJJ02339.1 hypothetical protein ASPVEDRAFT_668992 [Aspergillus versicolor CBS 583.65]
MAVFFSSYFVLTTPGHFSDRKAQCVAYVERRGSMKRCGSNWTVSEEGVMDIGNLQGKYKNESEPEKRAGILRDIATCCLCGNHFGKWEAAVYQWENEIQSQARNSELGRFVTSQPQRGRQRSIDFRRYGRQEIEEASDLMSLLEREVEHTEDVLEHMKAVDRKAINYLISRLERSQKAKGNKRVPSSFLYVFSHHAAEDFYKVGTGNGKLRIRQQELCYPGLVVQCLIFCPNAQLFENMVHAEFSADRYYHICDGHGTPQKHTEWFKASLADILNSVTAWSAFSQVFHGENIRIDRREPIFCLPGGSHDRARWTKWARWQAEKWVWQSQVAADGRYRQDSDYQDSVNIQTPIRQRHSGIGSDTDYPSSPPELTPSSGPGSPDSGCDGPPTPTPSTRTKRGRYSSLDHVAIADASHDSMASFTTATSVTHDGWEPTLEERTPTEPGDDFWYPESSKDHTRSKAGPNDVKYVNFAGVTVPIPHSQEDVSSEDPLDVAERMMKLIFI